MRYEMKHYLFAFFGTLAALSTLLIVLGRNTVTSSPATTAIAATHAIVHSTHALPVIATATHSPIPVVFCQYRTVQSTEPPAGVICTPKGCLIPRELGKHSKLDDFPLIELGNNPSRIAAPIFTVAGEKPPQMTDVAPSANTPAEVLNALNEMSNARQDVATKQAIADANRKMQTQLDNDCIAARTSYAKSVTTYGVTYSRYFPPMPEPTPDVNPPGPKPDPKPPGPGPSPIVKPTLLLITTLLEEAWQCGACKVVRENTLPKLSLGEALSIISWNTDQARKLYSESTLVPRWVLSRGSATEKFEGPLTADQVNAWIGGKKP